MSPSETLACCHHFPGSFLVLVGFIVETADFCSRPAGGTRIARDTSQRRDPRARAWSAVIDRIPESLRLHGFCQAAAAEAGGGDSQHRALTPSGLRRLPMSPGICSRPTSRTPLSSFSLANYPGAVPAGRHRTRRAKAECDRPKDDRGSRVASRLPLGRPGPTINVSP